MGGVQPISVDALLLRTQLPELVLRPGASVVARVASRAEAHGVLVLAGMALTAELPEEVAAGQTLRLTVTEVSTERVVLRMEPPPVAPAAPPPDAPPRPQVGVEERPHHTGATERHPSVALSFQSQALGRLDLRIELDPGGVRVGVAAPPGAASELAGRHADELRDVLEQHLGGRAWVRVDPRREPLDLYA
jgi:hypothetical protein